MYECPTYVLACQKRPSDPLIDGCEPLCGCWELNSGPLEEQPVSCISNPQALFKKKKNHMLFTSLLLYLHISNFPAIFLSPVYAIVK